MIYGIIGISLIFLALGYFRLAAYYNIIDKPNERSSHTQVTIRGGGVLFPLALLLWFFFWGFAYPWFTAGLLIIATISFVDDILTLSARKRLAVHLFSVALMFMEMGFVDFAWYWWIPAFVLVIGWLNAFNFMDGINGITVFYALSVLLPLGVLNSLLGFTSPSIIVVTGLAAGVFAFFNARRRAKTFAGDVGSVSMAFILAFLMIQLLLHTGRWEYILFLSVYGVDAVMTITHRLIRRENIFKPHRTHLYQYLANELKIPHVLVSLLYAFTQMLVSLAVILAVQQGFGPALALALLTLLPLGYTFGKILILQRLSTEEVAKARTAR